MLPLPLLLQAGGRHRQVQVVMGNPIPGPIFGYFFEVGEVPSYHGTVPHHACPRPALYRSRQPSLSVWDVCV